MEAAARQLVIEGKSHLLRIEAIPFSEAATQFLSWAEGEYPGDRRRSYLRIKSSFAFIRHFFGKAIVAAITEGSIEDFKSARRKIGIKEISIRHDLHTLSLFFQYAMKKRWARENLVRKVEIPSDAESVRMNILSPDQEQMYFDACRWMKKAARFIPSPDPNAYSDLYDFGRLMIQQGCRPEEFLELAKAEVDFMRRWLHVLTGKSKHAKRRLKLTEESAEILKRRMATPGPWVFPAPRDPRKQRTTFQRSHDSVLLALTGKPDTPDCVPYDFRHTFATRAAVDGMPLPVLAAILGHSPNNLKSVAKYIHVASENIDREMERLEKKRGERKTFAGFLPPTPGKRGEETVTSVNFDREEK